MATFEIPDKTTIDTVDRSADLLLIYDNSASSLKKTTVNLLLDLTSHPVGLTDSQTLTNKTLTSPTISSPTLSGTIAGTYTIGGTPTFPATVVTTTGTQTLTNKTLTSPTVNTATIVNPTLTTDTVSEHTAANGVTVDGLNIKDGKLNTANSVDSAAYIDGSIDPEHLISGTGASWTWQSWTPTFTNLTVGNGTLTAAYTQIGKTVFARVALTFGNTTSISGVVSFTLPVTSVNSYGVEDVLGTASLQDIGTANYVGTVRFVSTTSVDLAGQAIPSTYLVSNAAHRVTGSVPFSWGTGDRLFAQWIYEAA